MNGRLRLRDMVAAATVLLLAWAALARLLHNPCLPAPHVVAARLFRDMARGELAAHAAASLGRVLGGMAITAGVALPLGLLMAQDRRLNRLLAPFVYLVHPVPKVVLAPVILLLFGLGEAPKVLLIVLILVSPVLVQVRDSAAALPRDLLISVRALGARPAAMLRFVYLPATLPALFSALRQSAGTALAVLYLAEMTATTRGLGYYIYFTGSTLLDFPAMYAGVVTMAALGVLLFLAVDAAERRLCRWRCDAPHATG